MGGWGVSNTFLQRKLMTGKNLNTILSFSLSDFFIFHSKVIDVTHAYMFFFQEASKKGSIMKWQ